MLKDQAVDHMDEEMEEKKEEVKEAAEKKEEKEEQKEAIEEKRAIQEAMIAQFDCCGVSLCFSVFNRSRSFWDICYADWAGRRKRPYRV